MRAVSAPVRSEPVFFVGPNSSVVADIESSLEAVFEVSMDNVVAEKEVAALPSDPQTWRREEDWLTIS